MASRISIRNPPAVALPTLGDERCDESAYMPYPDAVYLLYIDNRF